jgi:hypothetical protein
MVVDTKKPAMQLECLPKIVQQSSSLRVPTYGLYRDKENHQISNISINHFHPGIMPTSDWTRSVRALRDIPVADFSAPSVNTTRRVVYRPPILLFRYPLASGLQYNGSRCENLSSQYFYIKLEECNKKVRTYDTTRP